MFEVFDRRQFFVPVMFETPRDEAVLGFDGAEAALGEIGFVMRAFQPELPLLVHLLGAVFDLIERGQRDFQLSRLHGFEECGRDSGIHRIAPQTLARGLGALGMQFSAHVIGKASIGETLAPRCARRSLADRHAPSAAATEDNPLQKRQAFTDSATLIIRVIRAIVIESLLVA